MVGGLDWRWVGIGVMVMLGLNLVAGLILGLLVGDAVPTTAATPEEAAAVLGGGRLALGALISFASFAVGGYVVGLKSPGRTILEPGISAAVAVAIGLLLGGAFTLGNVLAGGLVPFLAGLLGGYLGERRQSVGAGTVGTLNKQRPARRFASALRSCEGEEPAPQIADRPGFADRPCCGTSRDTPQERWLPYLPCPAAAGA